MPAPPGRDAGIGGGNRDDRGFGPGGSQDRSSRDRASASISRTRSGGRTDESADAGQGGGGGGTSLPPMINPIIINQSPAPAPTPAGPAGPEVQGQSPVTNPRRSLLTLGLAETARKSLLGL